MNKTSAIILPGRNPNNKETVISHNRHPLCFGNNNVPNWDKCEPSPSTMQVEAQAKIIQSYESFSIPPLVKIMLDRPLIPVELP